MPAQIRIEGSASLGMKGKLAARIAVAVLPDLVDPTAREARGALTAVEGRS